MVLMDNNICTKEGKNENDEKCQHLSWVLYVLKII